MDFLRIGMWFLAILQLAILAPLNLYFTFTEGLFSLPFLFMNLVFGGFCLVMLREDW